MLASQAEEPMLTLLAYELPFTLDVELGRETLFHSDLATLVLHTLVETSLVARISVVHQSSKPEQHMLGSIELQSPPFW